MQLQRINPAIMQNALQTENWKTNATLGLSQTLPSAVSGAANNYQQANILEYQRKGATGLLELAQAAGLENADQIYRVGQIDYGKGLELLMQGTQAKKQAETEESIGKDFEEYLNSQNESERPDDMTEQNWIRQREIGLSNFAKERMSKAKSTAEVEAIKKRMSGGLSPQERTANIGTYQSHFSQQAQVAQSPAVVKAIESGNAVKGLRAQTQNLTNSLEGLLNEGRSIYESLSSPSLSSAAISQDDSGKLGKLLSNAHGIVNELSRRDGFVGNFAKTLNNKFKSTEKLESLKEVDKAKAKYNFYVTSLAFQWITDITGSAFSESELQKYYAALSAGSNPADIVRALTVALRDKYSTDINTARDMVAAGEGAFAYDGVDVLSRYKDQVEGYAQEMKDLEDEMLKLAETLDQHYFGDVGASTSAKAGGTKPESTGSEKETLKGYVSEAAEKFNIDADWLKALIKQESNWNSGAKSKTGVRGYTQMTKQTFTGLGYDLKDFDNPKIKAEAAAKYLSNLYKQFGDYEKAVAAYNVGAEVVEKVGLSITTEVLKEYSPYKGWSDKELEDKVKEVKTHVEKVKRYYGDYRKGRATAKSTPAPVQTTTNTGRRRRKIQ